MSWWDKYKKKKCNLCNAKIKGESSELRVNTSEGELELEICTRCADIIDKSAEVLTHGRQLLRNSSEAKSGEQLSSEDEE